MPAGSCTRKYDTHDAHDSNNSHDGYDTHDSHDSHNSRDGHGRCQSPRMRQFQQRLSEMPVSFSTPAALLLLQQLRPSALSPAAV